MRTWLVRTLRMRRTRNCKDWGGPQRLLLIRSPGVDTPQVLLTAHCTRRVPGGLPDIQGLLDLCEYINLSDRWSTLSHSSWLQTTNN